jgi:hypothetical protein
MKAELEAHAPTHHLQHLPEPQSQCAASARASEANTASSRSTSPSPLIEYSALETMIEPSMSG